MIADMKRLLIVDDPHEGGTELDGFLASFGFDVQRVLDVSHETMEQAEADLVVISQELTPANCNQVLKSLRRESAVPVIVVSKNGDVTNRVIALEMGADDYLVKPFEKRELVARIKTILRRSDNKKVPGPPASQESIRVGDIHMHVAARRVLQSGKDINLTSLEFELLRLLLQSAGQAVSRNEISRQILGREPSNHDRSIDVHISGLRKKLGRKLDGLERIRTVRGFGYIYALPLSHPTSLHLRDGR